MSHRRHNPPLPDVWNKPQQYTPAKPPAVGRVLQRPLDPKVSRLRMLAGDDVCLVDVFLEGAIYERMKKSRGVYGAKGQRIVEVDDIGRGGYGDAWLVTLEPDERGKRFTYVVKVDQRGSEGGAKRICKEAEVLAALPKGVSADLLDVEANSFAMTYIEGGKFRGREVAGSVPISSIGWSGSPPQFDVATARNYLAGLKTLVERIQQAHEISISHNDLKFGNVLQTSKGWVPIDWGMAGMFGDPAPRVGSPGFVDIGALSQSGAQYRACMDAYALSVMLFCVLTRGAIPWAGTDTMGIIREQMQGDIGGDANQKILSHRDWQLVRSLVKPNHRTGRPRTRCSPCFWIGVLSL